MIQNLIPSSSVLGTLIDNIDNSRVSVFGTAIGEKLTILGESGKFILFVCKNKADAFDVAKKLSDMKYRTRVLTDDYNYDNVSLRMGVVMDVMDVLASIEAEALDALIVTPNVLKLKVPNRQYVANGFLKVCAGQEVDIDSVVARLAGSGFERREIATERATYALRGEILDIVTPNGEGYRIVFDYDQIESIKKYNVISLLTQESIEELNLNLLKFLDVDNRDAMLAYNIPFAKNCNSSIVEFLPDALMVIDDTKACWDSLIASIKEHNEYINTQIDCGNMTSAHKSLIWDESVQTPKACVAFQYIYTDNKFFKPNKVFNISCAPTLNYSTNLNALISDIKTYGGYTTILFAFNSAGSNKISKLLQDSGLHCNICDTYSKIHQNEINIINKAYPVSALFLQEKLFIVGSSQLFAKPKEAKTDDNLTSYDGFLPQSGDIVVHTTHGVGKCLGVECLKLSSNNRDYVIIEYLGGDRLYLPVENIDSIAKFVGADTPPKFNKLGSTEFVKTKAKIKGELKELGYSLVSLYKARMEAKGYKYPADDELQLKFEASFGYELTADQAQAIDDIKSDMTSGKVMDRLVCGDVGFGKTEVALRAAFKTICAGKQVAFLCPTTILSEQHYNTAIARMKSFGVNVQVLNRFKSDKETADIMASVESGKIDMLVGTTKLLNSKVKFKNLGLLILDEEQKFGVGDKEKIKNLKNNINVLTLSATPIPRTLNMSLSGIRDISIISTPPVSRLTTAVQVVEYSDTIVANVVARELDRGGQVLVIYNKVESIYSFASHLRSILKSDCVLDVAHGQMDKKSLEDAIFRLYNGSTQVLVATTLIENGVDLPNANTLVVVDADTLGLSQLYQLKGRIGRSDKQAYAYFMFANKNLGESAYKRLEAITEFTAMGSGFKIAMRDLEIRGAGNVLGAEQSGHMQKIGYSLYIQLLNEAVSEIKGKPVFHTGDVRIETSLDAFIPTYYCAQNELRIRLYSKIASIKSMQELHDCLDYIQNVCGSVPVEVDTLAKIALIKNLAAHLGVVRVCIKDLDCSLTFENAELMTNFVDGIKKYDYVEYLYSPKPIIKFNSRANSQSKLEMVLDFLLENSQNA